MVLLLEGFVQNQHALGETGKGTWLSIGKYSKFICDCQEQTNVRLFKKLKIFTSI